MAAWCHAARWTARTAGLLYFAVIAWFVTAHALEGNLPDLWRASLAVQLDSLALFFMVVGGVVGWRWEGAASLMALLGTAIWLAVEGHLPWPPGLSLMIGLLYGFAWCYSKWRITHERHSVQ